MLVETLMALAAAGGTAVVQAAGTDAWAGFRQAVARWFARGDAQREQAELERLDQTAVALESADATEVDRVRVSSEAAWHARIESALERLDEPEREQAADQLRTLLAQLRAAEQASGISVVTGAGSAVFTGDAHAQASGDGFAFGQVAGDVHMNRGAANGERPDPSEPGRSRP
ncbi:hypothetical protein SAMN04487983_104274 [Streptomyces sp. yr375]|uniref:hypothetical protein n=1 Tax=Streptomyces sp. yr375 TaxID=1761906 RepID=UPI0008CDF729|nr:hypothetical protein [Streptomyces sp. yr375]SES32180.1 hypothetical protein SAMN04487983_104274 [Streptomyces sp. yr375]